MKTIGIIGAQGKLGTKLSQKLEQLERPKFQLLQTTDTLHNREIACESDLLLLMVPPENVGEVLLEIKDDIKEDVEIVSFAAAVPMDYMSAIVGKPVARVMMDPRALVGMFVPSTTKTMFFEKVVESILQYPLQYASSDHEIDEFTVASSYFFTAVTWAFVYQKYNWEKWLESHLELDGPKFKFTREVMDEIVEAVRSKGDFKNNLKTMATNGGVTEVLIETLTFDPNISAVEIWNTGLERIAEMREAVNRVEN